MESAEDKGFEVIDKRRRKSGGGEEQSSAPEKTEAKPEATDAKAESHHHEEEHAGEEQGAAESVVGDVYSLIQWFIVMLAEAAWQWMGLHINPVTKDVKKDMAQAKIAIDSVVFLCDQMAPHVSEEQRAANRDMIMNLRMNFVQQQDKQD